MMGQEARDGGHQVLGATWVAVKQSYRAHA